MENETKEFTQKHLNTRHKFCFDEDDITVTFSNLNGEDSIRYSYENIDIKPSRTASINNTIIRYAALITCAGLTIGSLVGFFKHIPIINLNSIIYLFIAPALAYFIYTRYQKITYVFFATSQGEFAVQRDEQYDAILETLKKYWDKKMKAIYGKIDFTNHPEKEITKFNWLKNKGVISAEELENAIQEINTKVSNHSLPGERPLN